MKKLLIILLLFRIAGFAQIKMDSLWRVWNDRSQADTNRLKAMHKIASDGYQYTQPDSAFYYAQMEFNLADSTGNKKYMAMALNTQGVSFFYKGDYARANDYHTRSLKIREEIGDKKGIAGSLGNIGNTYARKGDYAKAIDYFTRCLKTFEEIGDKRGMATAINNIGTIYQDQGDYAKAIDYHTRSLKIMEETGNKRGMALTLSNLGNFHWSLGDYAKALDYNQRSLMTYQEIGDKSGIAESLGHIAGIYQEQGAYVKAMDYHTRSLKIDEEIGNKNGIAASLGCIGLMYKDQGDYAKAIEYQKRSLKIKEEIGEKKGIAFSLIVIGNIYSEQGDYTKAISYGQRALNIAREIGNVENIKDASNSLFSSYKATGQYSKSLEMYELHITMRDSLKSEENEREVIRQEFKYNYEKEALADSIKNAEAHKVLNAEILAQAAELKQERTQRFALYAGVVVLLLFGGFTYNRFKKSQAQKKIIEEQKDVVDKAHKEITDSIAYAKRIQSAILPPARIVKEYLKESFILYKPKDQVAGDFYWMEHKEGKVLFAAADCTGHGVPGAMVSVICNNGLNRSVREHGLSDPGKILDKTREIVIQEFEKSEEEVKDGMDISLCSLHTDSNELLWSGANNPILIIRNGEVLETKPDKQAIGKVDNPKPFTTHSITLEKGDVLYIFTDGFQDQFGGEKGKKFKQTNLKKLLLSIQTESMEKQREIIDSAFEEWKGILEQVDDVCVIGVKV